MSLFTQHKQQQGVTYIEHLLFAAEIAWRLSGSVSAFAVHAIFPFIEIDKTLDLEATVDYLQERNRWIENAKLNEEKNLSATEEVNNSMIHWVKKGIWLVLFS